VFLCDLVLKVSLLNPSQSILEPEVINITPRPHPRSAASQYEAYCMVRGCFKDGFAFKQYKCFRRARAIRLQKMVRVFFYRSFFFLSCGSMKLCMHPSWILEPGTPLRFSTSSFLRLRLLLDTRARESARVLYIGLQNLQADLISVSRFTPCPQLLAEVCICL
jgi:hypothetical protein